MMVKIAINLLKILLVFVLSFIVILKIGIKIDSFELAGLKLEQLYIKLDKKIIFTAQNITLPKLKAQDTHTSGSEFYKLSQNAIWLDKIFQEISLTDVNIGDMSLQILYKDDTFFIDSPHITVDIKILEMIDKNTEKININNLNFKDFNLSIFGNASANLKDKKYAFSGKFKTHEIAGGIDLALIKDDLKYKIYDANATSLKNFMQEITKKTGLDKEVSSWIYGYIKAQNYHIKELNGRINIATAQPYLNELKGEAQAQNLQISLDKSLKDINVEDANITLENSRLDFSLNKPTYSGKKLDGSSLHIYELFDEKKAGIFINIKTNSIYDKSINDILKAYKISVPVEQKSGKTRANLDLNITFNDLNVVANGKFDVSDAKIDIADAPFSAKSANIELKNTDKLAIKAKDFGLNFFNSDASVDIDLLKSKGDISGRLKELSIGEILSLKDENLTAVLDYSGKNTLLTFANLGLELSFGSKNKINVTNKALIAHSALLSKLSINGFESINIQTSDFENFDIIAKEATFDLPFYKKDGKIYNIDTFNIDVKENLIKGNTKSGHLNFEIADEKEVKLGVNNLDVLIKASSDDDNSSLTDSLGDINANLQAKNSNIILEDFNRTLELKEYQVWAKQDFIKLGSNAYGGRINLSKNKDEITIEARDIDGKFVNQLFGSETFEGGKFKLKVTGTKEALKGEIRFYDTYFKDYIFYQQLLTFINSIPSLLSLKTPDFNQKGFSAKNGKILLEKNGDILKFIAIEIHGTSADILGAGTINLKTKDIDVDLQIEFLKDASSIIENIPIVNQILLGKERKLSTLIKLRGTTEKPEYSSQVLTDTLLAPFKIIRNILQAPFLIFE
ncbi:hypothetical protein LMG8286_00643 [Campylobacter suis]|uniref:YhdP central domain-containing protein n=2 Tax=Campylobacter suis TaxID=2790657 RepID=A0ABN7K4Y9_9BACT|nr:hypothetical protein LMG8286_00643 [Campylobacter suis]